MSAASDFINAWTSDLANTGKKWEIYTVLPYARAYRRAAKGFEETIAAQKAADEASKDSWLQTLGLLALSLAGGGLLTAAFGSAVLKELAATAATSDRVLNSLIRNNMNRTYKAIEYVATNKTASFIGGKVWDAVESGATDYASSRIKESMRQSSSSFPSINQYADNPEDLKDALMMFIGECQTKLHDMAAFIRDNTALKDDAKIAAVKLLGMSPFFKPATRSVDPGDMDQEIELSFYCKMVLDTDVLLSDYQKKPNYEERGRAGWRITGHYYAPGKRNPIDELPSSTNYPKPSTSTVSTPGYQSIEYKKVGDKFVDKLNGLYKKKFNWPFGPFTTQPDATELRLAEQAIATFSNSNIQRLVTGAK
jgi:hypothetical protein